MFLNVRWFIREKIRGRLIRSNYAVNIAQRANHPTSTILPIDGKM